jgi:hypothetical protein
VAARHDFTVPGFPANDLRLTRPNRPHVPLSGRIPNAACETPRLPRMSSRLAVLTAAVALLAGAGGGYAAGAHRSDERADNCQAAAQEMYDSLAAQSDLRDLDDRNIVLFSYTDDFCPIDQGRR